MVLFGCSLPQALLASVPVHLLEVPGGNYNIFFVLLVFGVVTIVLNGIAFIAGTLSRSGFSKSVQWICLVMNTGWLFYVSILLYYKYQGYDHYQKDYDLEHHTNTFAKYYMALLLVGCCMLANILFIYIKTKQVQQRTE